MIRVEHRFVLPGPPELVFPYIANPAHDHDWQSACTESRLRGPEPVVGCQYDIAFLFSGRKLNFVGVITEREPCRSFGFKTLEGSFPHIGRHTFTEHPQGTQVHWTVDAEPGRFFGIVPLALLRKLMLHQLQRDVAALVVRAERDRGYVLRP